MRKPGESVYCLSFWRDKFKGKSGDEPYFDVVEDGISAGKVMRIYVDAKRFPTWQKWKDEADKARACAYIDNASMCGYFVKGGTSYAGEIHAGLHRVQSYAMALPRRCQTGHRRAKEILYLEDRFQKTV